MTRLTSSIINHHPRPQLNPRMGSWTLARID